MAQALGVLAKNGATVGAAVEGQHLFREGLFSELDELRASVSVASEDARAAAAGTATKQTVAALMEELHSFKESTNEELASLRRENASLRAELGAAEQRAAEREAHAATKSAHAIAEASLVTNRDMQELSRHIGQVDGTLRKMEERVVSVMADGKSGREVLGAELESLRGEGERQRLALSKAEERIDGSDRAASKVAFDVEALKKSTQLEFPKLGAAVAEKADAELVDVLEMQMKEVRSTIGELATKLAGNAPAPPQRPALPAGRNGFRNGSRNGLVRVCRAVGYADADAEAIASQPGGGDTAAEPGDPLRLWEPWVGLIHSEGWGGQAVAEC